MNRSPEFERRQASTKAALGAIALTAMCLAVGVYWAQPLESSSFKSSRSGARAGSWAREIESGAEHITPTELAAALLSHPADYVLVDVRPAVEFAAYHLPGAHALDLAALLGSEGNELLELSGDRTVVLYSNGMVHPAQAWVELARRGYANIRVLEGGLAQLRADVLTPPSLRPGYDRARARRDTPAYQAARDLLAPQARSHS